MVSEWDVGSGADCARILENVPHFDYAGRDASCYAGLV